MTSQLTDQDGGGPLVAVVPLRGGGKSRLGAWVQGPAREALVGVVARSVVGALVGSGAVTGVLVVTGDPAVAGTLLGAGPLPGVRVVPEPADVGGLNGAVAFGCAVAAREATRVLVVHADLPALTPQDVRVLTGCPTPVALAPDRHGEGTNALVLDTAVVAAGFGFRFGPGSRARHEEQADRMGAQVTTVDLPGTSSDLDTPQDWWALPQDVRQRVHAGVAARGWDLPPGRGSGPGAPPAAVHDVVEGTPGAGGR
ncbi:2-phospho-L-lactate guanylyltransferase [Cellulomonas bogoriensis]|uniref:2-phospho-L-lactate guanylyltransferase n=1 Tax=Cellulomonas bogoriensis 69B4 = DSM 16987 TaxID=1386082 RepID=A0A0A0C0J5_9CELL|nr:2-phospho-L-lactate guanylyltransferase [Cellulomonas bogoriensis]KGM13477.1 2-phospho-L-lactate guanylyltransferase [Cellulomonas bogoriensis 69B4 = DSM 16987]